MGNMETATQRRGDGATDDGIATAMPCEHPADSVLSEETCRKLIAAAISAGHKHIGQTGGQMPMAALIVNAGAKIPDIGTPWERNEIEGGKYEVCWFSMCDALPPTPEVAILFEIQKRLETAEDNRHNGSFGEAQKDLVSAILMSIADYMPVHGVLVVHEAWMKELEPHELEGHLRAGDYPDREEALAVSLEIPGCVYWGHAQIVRGAQARTIGSTKSGVTTLADTFNRKRDITRFPAADFEGRFVRVLKENRDEPRVADRPKDIKTDKSDRRGRKEDEREYEPDMAKAAQELLRRAQARPVDLTDVRGPSSIPDIGAMATSVFFMETECDGARVRLGCNAFRAEPRSPLFGNIIASIARLDGQSVTDFQRDALQMFFFGPNETFRKKSTNGTSQCSLMGKPVSEAKVA